MAYLRQILVAMVTVFKNSTTIAITLGDCFFFLNPISPGISGLLAAMVALYPRTWGVVMGVDELMRASHPLLHSGNL